MGGFYFGLVFFWFCAFGCGGLICVLWCWDFFFELYVQKEYFLFTGGDRKDNCPSEKLKVLG